MNYLDQRKLHLKIKIKTLVEESKIIRAEEKKFNWIDEQENKWPRSQLREHRITVVRNHTRHNLIAYGCLNGVPYENIEKKCRELPDFDCIKKIAVNFSNKYDPEVLEKIENWIEAAKEYCTK